MNPEIQKRLARVAKSLTEIQDRIDAAQKTAKKKVALDQEPLDLKKLAPAVNAVDEKMKAMDKTTTGLLNALSNNNQNNAKTLLKTLVKMIEGLSALKDKNLAVFASTKPRGQALNKALARAKSVVARAKRQLQA